MRHRDEISELKDALAAAHGELLVLRRQVGTRDAATPGGPATPVTRTPTGPLRGIEAALYRRVIEIRDAQLALRPYIPPNLPNQVAEAVRAAGLEQDQANRVIEVTDLAAAIAAHHAGHRYRSETTGIGIPHPGSRPIADLDRPAGI